MHADVAMGLTRWTLTHLKHVKLSGAFVEDGIDAWHLGLWQLLLPLPYQTQHCYQEDICCPGGCNCAAYLSAMKGRQVFRVHFDYGSGKLLATVRVVEGRPCTISNLATTAMQSLLSDHRRAKRFLFVMIQLVSLPVSNIHLLSQKGDRCI